MANVSKLFNFIIYADDTTLSSILSSFKSSSTNNINGELDKISELLKINKLSPNVKKTKWFSTHDIDRVKDFNFLGLVVNENLNWKSHTETVSNSMSKTIGILNMLNRLKHFVPLDIKTTLYNSLILSHINYCLLISGYECSLIFKLQKNSIRIVSISKYNAHTEPIFKKLKLLKRENILKLQDFFFFI